MKSKHGDSPQKTRAKEYTCWAMMKQRCLNPRSQAWANYGGRCIKVCQEWQDKENGYINFLGSVGRAPSKKHTIERKNNDGDYEPDNVCWATRKEQCKNRRPCINKLTGKRVSLREESVLLGGTSKLISRRLYDGWSLDKALSIPAKQRELTKYEWLNQYLINLPKSISRKIVVERLASGWSLNDAITKEKASRYMK